MPSLISVQLPFDPSWIGNVEARVAALRLLRCGADTASLQERLDEIVTDSKLRELVWALAVFAYGSVWEFLGRVTPDINRAIDVEIEIAEDEDLQQLDAKIAKLMEVSP